MEAACPLRPGPELAECQSCGPHPWVQEGQSLCPAAFSPRPHCMDQGQPKAGPHTWSWRAPHLCFLGAPSLVGQLSAHGVTRSHLRGS